VSAPRGERVGAPRGGAGEPVAGRTGSALDRLVHAWRRLPHERRLAAIAALGLFVTLFLPWYQETVIASGVTSLRSVSASLTGWAAFSFVEAAVLLVAAGVLTLLFVRAEGQAFHVPGGDGGVITAAGGWTCALIVWRMFDKEGTTGHGQYATASGIEWGIFVALGVAGLLAYAGTRIRLAHEPEPPLPGERRARRRRGRGLTAAVRPGRGQAPGSSPADSSRERPPRSRETDLDETWIAADPGPVAPEDAGRKRPRSIGADEPPGPPRVRRLRAEPDPPDPVADPPTARLHRSGPDPKPDDQLTLRLDRPD
jgi:hypothetical protein